MKYLIVGDVHWSSYSSIVRARGEKYSLRLENLINTINWAEQVAVERGCDAVVYLGDFFDKADLNSEEITALNEIKWSNLFHWFLVGNHEMGISTLQYSSAHLFGQLNNFEVIDKPFSFFSKDNIQLCFLPYTLEEDRKPLNEYFTFDENSVVFSHNDIKGVQMGKFISTSGFSVDEIENGCRLFFNGHLHNASCIGKNIINVGNVTGQNFSEDAMLYRHSILIFDDTEFGVEWVENPFALNFYKLDLVTYEPKKDDEAVFKLLTGIGPNAVVSLKINPDEKVFIEDIVYSSENIVSNRIVLDMSDISTEVTQGTPQMGIDHISKFTEYIKANLTLDELTVDELMKVTQ